MEREIPVTMLRASANFNQSPLSLSSWPLTTLHHLITTPRRVHYPRFLTHACARCEVVHPIRAKVLPHQNKLNHIRTKMCRSPLSSPSSLPRHPMWDLGGPQFLIHRLSKLGRRRREKLRRSTHSWDRAGWRQLCQ